MTVLSTDLIHYDTEARLVWANQMDKGIEVSRLCGRVLELLMKNAGDPVHQERFMVALYGDDPNGGPVNASTTLRVYVSHLRKALRMIHDGYLISNLHGGSYTLLTGEKRVTRTWTRADWATVQGILVQAGRGDLVDGSK